MSSVLIARHSQTLIRTLQHRKIKSAQGRIGGRIGETVAHSPFVDQPHV